MRIVPIYYLRSNLSKYGISHPFSCIVSYSLDRTKQDATASFLNAIKVKNTGKTFTSKE